VCASGTADPGLPVRIASLSIGPPMRTYIHLLNLGSLGEKKVLVASTEGDVYTAIHVTTGTPAYNCSFSLFHSLTALLYVSAYAHTRTIKMWRTRRCSGAHAHPVIHEEGQKFEHAPHVTSVHGVSEMPALTPRQDRSWTNLSGVMGLGCIETGRQGPFFPMGRVTLIIESSLWFFPLLDK
jgi:hypothetical protein